jgi:hypothetical protein
MSRDVLSLLPRPASANGPACRDGRRVRDDRRAGMVVCAGGWGGKAGAAQHQWVEGRNELLSSCLKYPTAEDHSLRRNASIASASVYMI